VKPESLLRNKLLQLCSTDKSQRGPLWALKRLKTRPRTVLLPAVINKGLEAPLPFNSMSSTASLPTVSVLALAPGCV
jgi:hypothetical protein